jgi:hypothetical protein
MSPQYFQKPLTLGSPMALDLRLRLEIHFKVRNDEIQDSDCKPLSSLVYQVCTSCLNHNVPMLKFLRMLLLSLNLYVNANTIKKYDSSGSSLLNPDI